ncbi:MAG: leucyl/phenylalanyl-tRNA--protein transferase [Novosphingobium sp.]
MHSPVGMIEPETLMLGYRSGIFPMADSRDDVDVFWVEPKRRAILPLGQFRCSRSLARTLRRERFSVTCNQAFTEVMLGCAAPRDEDGDTWISGRIAMSYQRLHEIGLAHSIECWQDGALVGGLYGVGFNRVFCGESMFSRVADASKVALAWLVCAMRMSGAELLDCQFITGHLASLGAVEITQNRYLQLLRRAQRPVAAAGDAEGAELACGVGDGDAPAAVLDLPTGFAALLAVAAGSSSSPGNFIAQSFTHTS